MAYFSNGTQAMIFKENWCERCVHLGRDKLSQQTDTPGCPVYDVHFLYADDALKEKQDHDRPLASDILDGLIKREGLMEVCNVFVEREGAPLPGQSRLPGV